MAPESAASSPIPAAPPTMAELPSGEHRLLLPVALRVTDAGFELVGHTGAITARFSARDVAAMASFGEARDIPTGRIDQYLRLGEDAYGESDFAWLARRLLDCGLLVVIDDATVRAADRAARDFFQTYLVARKRAEEIGRQLATRRGVEEERVRRTAVRRTKVVPVNCEGNPLLSLGLLMTYGEVWDGGRLTEHYEFVPDWGDQTVPALTGEEPPAVYLFSNYIWSHNWNVKRSVEIKTKSPGSVTVHGGPNTPKYDGDVEAFFDMNPDVDIAVHGEGEETFVELLAALQGRLGDSQPDLSVLRDVPGLTYRDRGTIVRTGKRDRIADLDAIPSPYETGLFDSVGDVEVLLMTIETNRGCPYGCTFCDWGSATMSRIRKFDLDRVFRDLEWCAKHKVKTIFCADANFGIFERDVDIARKVVELKAEYGYPKVFESSYAKNTVKHLREIIETLASGGILSTGTLSLQSVDPGTLEAVRRSNIRVDKYDELAVEFGKHNLPLVVELMMGLPGSTLTSFVGDMQQCIDREVKARVHPTEVLMNSPMNDPAYREDHQIATLRPVQHDWSEENGKRKKALVVSTSSYTRQEYHLMERYRRAFLMCENYAVLRQLSRYVRHETGTTEMELYSRLADAAAEGNGRWPAIEFTFTAGVHTMIPPVSWRLFVDEVGDFVHTQLGVANDSALRTVLDVQHALLPARDREFPFTIDVEHDYAAWHQALLGVKRGGHTIDWRDDVPRLSSFGPATFEVDDPQDVSRLGVGMSLFYDTDADWELQSPVARPMRFRHTIHA